MRNARRPGMSRSTFALGPLVALCLGCAPTLPSNPRGEEAATPVTSVDGEIMGVDRVAPSDRLASGVRVTLRPDGSPAVVVDLAPDWYLSARGLELDRAERMKVEGENRPGSIVYARRVEASGQTVELRDEAGQPLWIRPGE